MDDDYVLEIRVKDKMVNLNRYNQDAKLQDIIHALTALGQHNLFDLTIKKESDE